MSVGLYWIWWNLSDRTRHRPTGDPVAGGAAVGATLRPPVTALMPVSAGCA